ncbi:hypothetical protein Bca101_082400 [Brassica carinata]
MLLSLKKNRSEYLNLFKKCKIWKMHNNIVFQQKRDNIVKVIHDTVRESNQWKEVKVQFPQENKQSTKNTENNRDDQVILPQDYITVMLMLRGRMQRRSQGLGGPYIAKKASNICMDHPQSELQTHH